MQVSSSMGQEPSSRHGFVARSSGMSGHVWLIISVHSPGRGAARHPAARRCATACLRAARHRRRGLGRTAARPPLIGPCAARRLVCRSARSLGSWPHEGRGSGLRHRAQRSVVGPERPLRKRAHRASVRSHPTHPNPNPTPNPNPNPSPNPTGKGTYGLVYKGEAPGGEAVAVKVRGRG